MRRGREDGESRSGGFGMEEVQVGRDVEPGAEGEVPL